MKTIFVIWKYPMIFWCLVNDLPMFCRNGRWQPSHNSSLSNSIGHVVLSFRGRMRRKCQLFGVEKCQLDCKTTLTLNITQLKNLLIMYLFVSTFRLKMVKKRVNHEMHVTRWHKRVYCPKIVVTTSCRSKFLFPIFQSHCNRCLWV